MSTRHVFLLHIVSWGFQVSSTNQQQHLYRPSQIIFCTLNVRLPLRDVRQTLHAAWDINVAAIRLWWCSMGVLSYGPKISEVHVISIICVDL